MIEFSEPRKKRHSQMLDVKVSCKLAYFISNYWAGNLAIY